MLIVCNCKFIFHMNVIHLFRKCLHIYVNVCAQSQIPQESICFSIGIIGKCWTPEIQFEKRNLLRK